MNMLLAVEIIGIICMVTLAGISVVNFILFNKIFGQLRYKNYLMEKLTQNIYMIASKRDNAEVCGDNSLISKNNDKSE